MTRRTFFAKILISLTLMAFFALKVDIAEFKSMASNIHFSYWLFALAFMALQIAGLAVRWTLLVNIDSHTKRMGLMTSLRITAVSLLANYLITTLGGIIARTALTMSHGFPFVKSITAALIDRGMTMLVLLILTAFFLPFLWDYLDPALINLSALFVSVLLMSITFFAFVILYKNRRAIIFSNRRLAVGYKYLRALLTDPKALARIISVSLASQIMYFAAVYIIMQSLGADLSFFKFMAVIPIITLVATLPIGYGGWGIREGAFMVGLGLVDIPLEAAFMASVQIGLLSMLVAVIAGIPAFIDDETQDAIKYWRHKNLRKRHADR